MTAKPVDEMSDPEFIAVAYKGDRDAVRLWGDLLHVAHVLDDLIDGDKQIGKAEVIDSYWRALIHIPTNPFYAAHAGVLAPLMSGSLLNWQIANVLERGGQKERELAHSMRHDLGTVFVMIAFIIGGRVWAEGVGPEIRMRCQRQPLAEYLAECEQRFPAATEKPAAPAKPAKKAKGDGNAAA